MATFEKSAGMTPIESSTSIVPVHGTAAGARPERDAIVRTACDGLPFVVTSQTARGRWIGVDYFDPPINGDGDGAIAGLQAMAALLTALEHSDDAAGLRLSTNAREALIDAGKKAGLCGGPTHKAAFSFIQAAAHLLEFAARSANWRGYIAEQIEARRRDDRFIKAYKAERGAEFSRRMAAAKAAKRKAARATTCEGAAA